MGMCHSCKKFFTSIEIPLLKKCCCCFPLRKGLLGYGYLNLIAATWVIAQQVRLISLERKDGTKEEAEFEINGIDDPRVWEDGTKDMIDNDVWILVVVELTINVIQIIMLIILLVALHKHNPVLLKIFLYADIVISIIGFVYNVIFVNFDNGPTVLVALFQLMLHVYLIIMVWNLLVTMERQRGAEGTLEYSNGIELTEHSADREV